jgi:L-ascorbate metabolism protein UlaG (beta-lactamase superfamily)
MTIIWHGFSCIKFIESTKDGDLTVLVDPFKEETGVKTPRSLSADIVISSVDMSRHNNVGDVDGKPFVVSTSGEFEVKDIFVTSLEHSEEDAKGKRVVHSLPYITMSDMHILHLGGIKTALSEKEMENIGAVDVLCIPVGGGDAMSPAVAAGLVRELEPRVIIPMYYKADGFGAGLEPVDAFLKAVGMAKTEIVAKYKLTKKDLPQEDTMLVLLEPQ